MRENLHIPLFITFEGGEGAGKTTLIQHLANFLDQEGFSVVVTREPGGTKLGDQIRHWLLRRDLHVSIGLKTELLLFLAARAQHVEEVILPALSENRIVLCDRFHDSTIAYQGIARGLGADSVQALCLYAANGLQPDLTFYIDVDPQVGLDRSKNLSKQEALAGDVDRLEAEKLEFHQTVRQAFHQIAQSDPQRFHILDGNQPQDQVLRQAENYIKNWIKSYGTSRNAYDKS